MQAITARLDHAHLAVQGLAVILGSWLIAAGAYVEIPMWPVPMTMQSLAVLLIGGAYSLRLASITTAVYLTQGAMGLPVFAGGMAGPAHLIGPTGGYLAGFVVAACATAWLCERGWTKSTWHLGAALLIGSVLLMACGVLWLACFVGLDNAVATGLAPFVTGMAAKLALALFILKGADSFFRAR